VGQAERAELSSISLHWHCSPVNIAESNHETPEEREKITRNQKVKESIVSVYQTGWKYSPSSKAVCLTHGCMQEHASLMATGCLETTASGFLERESPIYG